MAHQAKSAIVGLGYSAIGKVYGRTGTSFALEAIKNAMDDAGLKKDEVDGLLIQHGITPCIGLGLQNAGDFDMTRFN